MSMTLEHPSVAARLQALWATDPTSRDWPNAVLAHAVGCTEGTLRKTKSQLRHAGHRPPHRSEGTEDFAQYAMEGLSIVALAERFRCSEEAVRQRMARLRAQGWPILLQRRAETRVSLAWTPTYPAWVQPTLRAVLHRAGYHGAALQITQFRLLALRSGTRPWRYAAVRWPLHRAGGPRTWRWAKPGRWHHPQQHRHVLTPGDWRDVEGWARHVRSVLGQAAENELPRLRSMISMLGLWIAYSAHRQEAALERWDRPPGERVVRVPYHVILRRIARAGAGARSGLACVTLTRAQYRRLVHSGPHATTRPWDWLHYARVVYQDAEAVTIEIHPMDFEMVQRVVQGGGAAI